MFGFRFDTLRAFRASRAGFLAWRPDFLGPERFTLNSNVEGARGILLTADNVGDEGR